MYYEKELSDLIIKSAYKVYDYFGSGFLEKVYENSLIIELSSHNLEVKNQYPISIKYDNIYVGEYYADILVVNKVIIELKACKNLEDFHQAQLLHYLKATGIKVGYLINFGNTKNLEFKRLVF